MRRGFTIKENQKILIIEDVITTGKSSIECSKLVKKNKGIIVGKDNEFLLKELEKSEEVIDLLISEVAEKMGIDVNIKILLSEKSKSGDSKGLDAAQEVFEVEDLN